MPYRFASLTDAAVTVISLADPASKVEATRAAVQAWRDGNIVEIGDRHPPDRPARPARPELRRPGDMPRRRKGGLQGRQAFVHAIAHIELNAIDLAWDIVARFADEDLPNAFHDDWVGVALDEANHFAMLRERLVELGCDYGDLPAHDGLWEAATETADDLMARLAVVPMILEARGLDTTPRAVEDLQWHGDERTAELLRRIGEEEVPHVAAGVRWFEYLCERRGLDPFERFRALRSERFKGSLKPPFNHELRRAAGMDSRYYAASNDEDMAPPPRTKAASA